MVKKDAVQNSKYGETMVRIHNYRVKTSQYITTLSLNFDNEDKEMGFIIR